MALVTEGVADLPPRHLGGRAAGLRGGDGGPQGAPLLTVTIVEASGVGSFKEPSKDTPLLRQPLIALSGSGGGLPGPPWAEIGIAHV